MHSCGSYFVHVPKYIKNQQEHETIKNRYDTDLEKDPFREASKIGGEDN